MVLTRAELVRVRVRALRRRVWLRATRRVERALVDATIKAIERVKSPALTEVKLVAPAPVSRPFPMRAVEPILARRPSAIDPIALSRAARSWPGSGAYSQALGADEGSVVR